MAEAVGDAAANLAAVANKPLPGEASANALLRACFDGMADASPAAQDCAAASLAQVCPPSPRKTRDGATQSYADAKTDVHTFRELFVNFGSLAQKAFGGSCAFWFCRCCRSSGRCRRASSRPC